MCLIAVSRVLHYVLNLFVLQLVFAGPSPAPPAPCWSTLQPAPLPQRSPWNDCSLPQQPAPLHSSGSAPQRRSHHTLTPPLTVRLGLACTAAPRSSMTCFWCSEKRPCPRHIAHWQGHGSPATVNLTASLPAARPRSRPHPSAHGPFCMPSQSRCVLAEQGYPVIFPPMRGIDATLPHQHTTA